ncbi:MAG: LysR family transcriptional regulator [Actinomycetota bacterium]|nr:LysR family transcriptional regulator [Actinomycetota bacterium]
MDVRALRYAVTLAEELHFGRAARRHVISAQPFGRRIQLLERELGTRLFERTSRRVTITPAGAVFVARARTVLARLDELPDVVSGLDPTAADHLRVGVLGFGASDRWDLMAASVTERFPDLDLGFVDLTFADQYDAVRTGRVDVALVHHVDEIDGLDLTPVLSSPRSVVLPARCPLADADHLGVDDLDGLRWLGIPADAPRLRSWLGFDPGGGAPSVDHPASVPSAVATTGCLGFHAAEAARYYGRPDVRFVPVDGAEIVVALATRSGDDRPETSAFRRAAAAAAAWEGAVTDETWTGSPA